MGKKFEILKFPIFSTSDFSSHFFCIFFIFLEISRESPSKTHSSLVILFGSTWSWLARLCAFRSSPIDNSSSFSPTFNSTHSCDCGYVLSSVARRLVAADFFPLLLCFIWTLFSSLNCVFKERRTRAMKTQKLRVIFPTFSLPSMRHFPCSTPVWVCAEDRKFDIVCVFFFDFSSFSFLHNNENHHQQQQQHIKILREGSIS